MISPEKIEEVIEQSQYLSRDLSWVQFNYRVLDQVRAERRTILEKFKFLAITASNLDEFFMIRVGSLYNYMDYNKQRLDYSGLRELPFRQKLLQESQDFVQKQYQYLKELLPQCGENNFRIIDGNEVLKEEEQQVADYFQNTIFPMLTPMVYDNYHTFPILMNKLLVFGVVTNIKGASKASRKVSFIQIPQNLPRFFELNRAETVIFLPIEEIIRKYIYKFFRNVDILGVSLIRITRNGDFTLDESDDMEVDFVQEVKQKLKTRKTGRVVRLEIESNYSTWMLSLLKSRWDIEDDNVFEIEKLIDLTSLWQIVGHKDLSEFLPLPQEPVKPLAFLRQEENIQKKRHDDSIFDRIKKEDIVLHHPYNSMEPVLEMIEEAAEDPNVLAIKTTIYRLAKDSRITSALLRAAENGKHVSVLFEVTARFDEENNIREAKKLQQAGCFVIYGITQLKTHTKIMLVVRKEGNHVVRYVHMSSGNYNESTAKLYTDVGLLTTNEIYARDVSEFFNAITGHSDPDSYEQLLTAPNFMRHQLIALIQGEARNALDGLPAGICIKVNSLQDKLIIDALYEASQAGVPIELIVRGICCIRPKREGLSENINVRSIVGDFLEHSRVFYFHNNGDPKIYSGSADAMVRSFDRRIESLFLLLNENAKQQIINLLCYNLKDTMNSYILQEDSSYYKYQRAEDEPVFNQHEEFFHITPESVSKANLYEEFLKPNQKLITPRIQNNVELYNSSESDLK
ncbi:polyphosphate kinase 1 [Bernardetia sp.]|uniref:polyphosphate kinase 1 n=1 Tax=Bernardetia sp. TaxID=1937974 RepID=UPI0025C130C1|nr:polyphosphate kinase 1 [Bernardetia sp.]